MITIHAGGHDGGCYSWPENRNFSPCCHGGNALICRMEDHQDMLTEGWWYYNAVLVDHNAIDSIEVISKLMVLLKREWEFMAEFWESVFIC